MAMKGCFEEEAQGHSFLSAARHRQGEPRFYQRGVQALLVPESWSGSLEATHCELAVFSHTGEIMPIPAAASSVNLAIDIGNGGQPKHVRA